MYKAISVAMILAGILIAGQEIQAKTTKIIIEHDQDTAAAQHKARMNELRAKLKYQDALKENPSRKNTLGRELQKYKTKPRIQLMKSYISKLLDKQQAELNEPRQVFKNKEIKLIPERSKKLAQKQAELDKALNDLEELANNPSFILSYKVVRR